MRTEINFALENNGGHMPSSLGGTSTSMKGSEWEG